MTEQWAQPHYPEAQNHFEQYDLAPDGLDELPHITLPQQASSYDVNIDAALYPQMVSVPFPLDMSNAIQNNNRTQTRQGDSRAEFGRPARNFPTMASVQRGDYQTRTVPFNPDLSYYSGTAQSFTTNGSSYVGLTSLRRSPPQASTSAAIVDGGNTQSSMITSPDLMQASFAGLQGERLTRSQPSFFAMTGDNLDNAVTPRPHLLKRSKPDENDVDELVNDGNTAGEQAIQKKSQGACQRCKGLKVKCEFMRESDPCKRCINAGRECVIPGRKKRRTPPKREHLINRIREQSEEISRLMAKLEHTNSQGLQVDDATSPDTDGFDDAKPDVKDWLQKARASVDALSGYIASASIPKSLIHRKDLEDLDSSDDDSEYDILVERAEEDHGFEYDIVENPTGADESQGSHRRSLSVDRAGRSKSRESMSSRGAGTKKDDKLAILPPPAVPFGLFANLALKSTRARRVSNTSEGETAVGVVSDNFFRASMLQKFHFISPACIDPTSSGPEPNPVPGRSLRGPPNWQVPLILQRGIIEPDEAKKLFEIYFTYMNLSVSLLDPALYTVEDTVFRSPFLFTVVCAVASRYYTERPGLHRQLIQYAQHAAGQALVSGHKSVEMVQAYLLLSLYPVPTRRWDEDCRWIYLGLAIRIATAMDLHIPADAQPTSERHEREMLNRTRVWLNCFNLDRSTSSEYGKSPIINNNDFVAQHSESWWESSQYNMKNFDIHICAYNAELRVMANFRGKIYSDPEHPTGLNKEIDIEKLASETDDALKQLLQHWFARLEGTDMTDPQNCFRTGLLRLAYSYARLIVLSFAFNFSFSKNNTGENPFMQRCLRAAFDVINTVVNDVGRPSQRIYLRHGPEAQSVFLTFASAFLLNLCKPKFASYLSLETRLEMCGMVQKVVDLLGSPEVAIDDRHGPKIYSVYLKGILSTSMARIRMQSSPKEAQRQRAARSPPSGSPVSLREGARTYDLPAEASPPAPDAPSPTSSTSLSSPPPPPPPPLPASFDHFAPVPGPYSAFGYDSDPAYPMSLSNFLPMHITQGSSGWSGPESLAQPSVPLDLSLEGLDWSSSDDAVMKEAELYMFGYNPS